MSPNVILATYAIVKNLQDELSSCCMTLAYEYSKCFTFMMLVSNWMVLVHNFLVVDLLESYIVQCRFNLDVCRIIGPISNDYCL